MEFFSLLISLFLFLSISPSSSLHSIDLERPVATVQPLPLRSYTSKGPKDVISCERVHIGPLPRHKLESYASSLRLTVAPSVVIPEKLHSRIQVCLHRNTSIELCQCDKDDWRPVQKGLWGSMTSPYEDKYIDIKFVGDISGSVTVTAEEEFQEWRLVCLALGVILLLVAPIVSSWVPFYYSSSMAIGILLVIIILLFQGMKLLPTGRKNVFYLTIYGSLLGAGSFLLHHFSMLVNSILVNFGLSDEMHNPVSIFLLVGIVLAGAALGYWMVRRFVISDDGSVDDGVAQFVKWAMRIIACTFILQGSADTLYAWTTLVFCWVVCSLVVRLKRLITGSRWRKNKQLVPRHNRAEFLRRSPKSSPLGKFSNSSDTTPCNWWGSPVQAPTGLTSPKTTSITPSRRPSVQKEYYSTFHRVPRRRKMSKREWEDFTQESTRQAMVELTSTPEFADWVVQHADRIQILPDDSSVDTVASGSGSTDETIVDNSPANKGFFKW